MHQRSRPTIHFLSSTRLAIVLAAILSATGCGGKHGPMPDKNSPKVSANNRAVTFTKGFYNEDAIGEAKTVVLRWAHQDTTLSVDVPADGRYRVTFLPFTVFSMEENIIEIRLGGQPVGKFATRAFDFSAAVPTPVELDLRAGRNDLQLHSARPEFRLGENDERLAAFGLLLPVTVEPAR